MLRLNTYKEYYQLVEILVIYILNVFKCGAGEGRRKLVRPIV
jgi:hypothetical protein